MQTVFISLTRSGCCLRKSLPLSLALLLALAAVLQAAEAQFESRTWTDKKGNQLTSTFVDAKNGEVQLKNDAGEVKKFKLADFSEPDQKYLRDLATYRRKLAAGEKSELPADPARTSLEIQPRQTIAEPVPEMAPARKPLLEFPVRMWTDTSGKKVQGKFVTAYNDKVVIDVKGNIHDLAVTRLSPDDQQYVAVQLKGLQRDDLVNVLAKAATAGQAAPAGEAAPAAAPAPAAVAANNPMAPPAATDDIHARLAQLKAQLHGNPDTGTQVAANTPAAQPTSTDDIQSRLAKIQQQKEAAGPSQAEQQMQEQQARFQEQQARMEQQRQEAEAQAQAQRDQIANQSVPVFAPQFTKQCGKCGRALPSNLTAGDKCPGCGIEFDFDETNGKRTTGSKISIGATVAAVVIGLIVTVVRKMSG